MKKSLPKSSANPMKLAKKLILTGLIISWLIMPELLWHKLVFVLHTFYESVSFVLEEMVVHALGWEKFYAQMTVFYFLSAMAFLALYLLWLRLPYMIQRFKDYLNSLGCTLKNKAVDTWIGFSLLQKIKFLLFQFAGMAGGLMVLLA